MPAAHQICPEFLHQLDSFQIRLVPGPKLQAASRKRQASSKLQASSFKLQAGFKLQASSSGVKVQAASFKHELLAL
jgi:hypothetical protein